MFIPPKVINLLLLKEGWIDTGRTKTADDRHSKVDQEVFINQEERYIKEKSCRTPTVKEKVGEEEASKHIVRSK